MKYTKKQIEQKLNILLKRRISHCGYNTDLKEEYFKLTVECYKEEGSYSFFDSKEGSFIIHSEFDEDDNSYYHMWYKRYKPTIRGF